MLEVSGQKINNIGGINIIILKKSIVKQVDSNYESYNYLVTIIIWSQKKIWKLKNFNIYFALSNQLKKIQKNLSQIKYHKTKTDSELCNLFSFFLPLSKDEKIEDSVIMRDNSSYEIKSTLFLS